MKKTNNSRKLRVDTTTIRVLSQRGMSTVAGGIVSIDPCVPTYTESTCSFCDHQCTVTTHARAR